MRRRREDPIGVILAGGRGTRIGGGKALVELRGRPLISYPLAAMQAVLHDVAVIAKPETELPSLPGVAVWIESGALSHPLIGLVEALGIAAGRPVLSCPLDLPFVTPALIESLARASRRGRPAVVASCAGALQPLLGRYHSDAAPLLTRSGVAGVAVRDAVRALRPTLFEVGDPHLLFNINAPEDLLTAAGLLDRISRR